MSGQPDGAARVRAFGVSGRPDGAPRRMSSPADGRSVTPDAIRWGPNRLVPGIVQDERDGTVLMLGYLDAEALAATLATGLVHFHSRSRGRLWRKGETSGNELHLRDIRLDCDADTLLLRVQPTGPTCHTGARSCFDRADEHPVDRADEHPAATNRTTAEEQPAAASPQQGVAPATGQGFAWLEELWATLSDRAATRPAGSYTVHLLEGGVDAVGRKVTEEATEVLMAAKDDAVAERANSVGTTDETAHAVSGFARAAEFDDVVRGDRRVATRAALAGEMADLLYHLLVLAVERGLPPADVLEVLRARHRR